MQEKSVKCPDVTGGPVFLPGLCHLPLARAPAAVAGNLTCRGRRAEQVRAVLDYNRYLHNMGNKRGTLKSGLHFIPGAWPASGGF